jgi:hypothetical protein
LHAIQLRAGCNRKLTWNNKRMCWRSNFYFHEIINSLNTESKQSYWTGLNQSGFPKISFGFWQYKQGSDNSTSCYIIISVFQTIGMRVICILRRVTIFQQRIKYCSFELYKALCYWARNLVAAQRIWYIVYYIFSK